MTTSSTIERPVAINDTRERTAALMHMIYIQTIETPDVDWETTLPKNWEALSERAKEFNRRILDTWLQNPEALEKWVQGLKMLAASSPPTIAKCEPVSTEQST